jgi:hypothetical protein
VSSTAVHAAVLDLRVTDETNKQIWCRVEVRGADKKMYQGPDTIPSGTNKARGGAPWYVGSFLMNGTTKVQLPACRYTVVVDHGLEYEHFERQIEVSDSEPKVLAVTLHPWIRMEKLGWWSADVHVHRSPEQAGAVGAAEDLNLVVLTDRNKKPLFEKNWAQDALHQEAPGRWVSLHNVEDERRGGSWILSGLKTPFPLERENGWNPPGLQYVRAALAQRGPGDVLPWFDIDMPIWWEVPVMVALETPDSIDIINNQFMQYGIDAGEYWGKPIDRTRYPGAKGFVDYTLDLYYRYLNLGYPIAPSAGTGSPVMPSPAGYNRTYAHFDGPFTLVKWYDAVRRGQSFVTNGPILFFKARQHGTRVKVHVSAEAREPIDRIEIVANGQVIQTWKPNRTTFKFHAQADLPAANYSWIAARCFLATDYTVRLAHSSPVYLSGKWNAHADAVYFVDWIDALLKHIQDEAGRHTLTSEQAAKLTALYLEARAVYARR